MVDQYFTAAFHRNETTMFESALNQYVQQRNKDSPLVLPATCKQEDAFPEILVNEGGELWKRVRWPIDRVQESALIRSIFQEE